MVGEGERGEGDVGFLTSGDAGCGNARQPGNQITDHSARCQPWLIFHSTRAAAGRGPAERQGGGHLQRAAKHGPAPLVRPCFSHQPGDANYHWVKRMSRSSALESGGLGRIFLTGSTASTSAVVSASARGTGGRQHGFTFTSQKAGSACPFASQVETCELNIAWR